jgi:class 3 adenylate cyclase
MNRLSLHFADAKLEAAYVEEQEQKSVRPRRMAALIAGGCVALVWTLMALGLQVGALDTGRMTLVAAGFLVFISLFYLNQDNQSPLGKAMMLYISGLMLFPMFVMSVIVILPPASLLTSGLALIIVHTFNNYGMMRFRFPFAVAGGWFTAAIYLGYVLGLDLLGQDDLTRHAFWLCAANVFGMFICYQLDLYARREYLAARALDAERAQSERLLLNILPASIAARLKESEGAIADHCHNVTVLFADLVGFTPLSSRKSPQELVQLLNRIFTEFDELAELHGLEKIKTIGDAYMAAAGLPEPRPDHARAAAAMALDMLKAVTRVATETGEALEVRIGLHSGPVVAGVIGRKKFSYDLWGDTVNIASRMESHGVPGAVQCSAQTASLLAPDYTLFARGAIVIEGKGEMETFLLEEKSPWK